jgi:hypothetical protein
MQMSKTRPILRLAHLAGLIACGAIPSVHAQSLALQVIAGDSSNVVTPDIPPSASRTLNDISVGDVGDSLFGFRLQGAAVAEGYWAATGSRVQRYAALGTAAAAGPGRSGAEAAHQFLSLPSGGGSVSPDGQRSFAARAGDPAATLNASHGQWRWDGVRNIEFARGSTDGVLGPGLGAGWVFPNSAGFGEARMLDAGHAVLIAEATNALAGTQRIIARHVPGSGNLPCMRTGTTEPALAPGITAGDSFANTTLSFNRVSAALDGRLYARLAVSGSREGIFELCDGAPRAFAADNDTGALGPDIGITGARFTGFATMPPQPSGDGVMFFANWNAPSQPTRVGLFHHDGASNRGIAYTEPSGFFGPNWENATWRSFDVDSLSVAGDMAAFEAGLETGGGDPVGLFRVRAGGSPELVALIGVVGGPYDPEDGRTWRTFDAIAVFDNGDIVLDATTNPDSTRDLWLLRQGQAPRRLLSPGAALRVPTSLGPVDTTITSYNIPQGGVRTADGTDTWIGIDGTLFFSAQAAGFGRVLLTARAPTFPPFTVHRDGFE